MTALSPAITDHVELDDQEVGELAVQFEEQEPEDLLEWALATFAPARLAIVTSLQIESLVLVDMALEVRPDLREQLRVMTIDTGRLPEATLEFLDDVRRHFDLPVEVVVPDAGPIERFVTANGPLSFRQSVEQRLLCCQLRKVQPLVGYLTGLDAWLTGLRRDQWATRANVRKVELDHDHGGIVKLNPLADWTEQDVWDYAEDRAVPVHPFYAQGYPSIGCAPCTRPVPDGADKRAGRWWWEENAPKECGMHCAIETGGFEHELHALLGDPHAADAGGER